jgi:hypothetical protein
MKNGLLRISLAAVVALLALHPMLSAAGLTVLTVPWEPTAPLSPHTTYPINPTTEATVTLGATVPDGVTTGDTVTVVWVFGDGSPNTAFPLANIYDISTTHQYPASASLGTAWTATVTVTDTTQHTSGTANYYLIQGCGPASAAPCTPGLGTPSAPGALASKVNVAIDDGLWYLHQTMWRNTTTVAPIVNWGGWDTQTYACPTVNGDAYACMYSGVINASNVQAFEVSGHYGTGPATDPYTDDVARGLARTFVFLASEANITTQPNTYQYNPATVNYGCSDGSQVQTNGTCVAPATPVYYDSGATSCTSPPCAYKFDGNNNGQMIYSNDGSGEPVYTGGPFMDALVASNSPNATAPTGPTGVMNATYQNIVQDMADWYGACQYEYDEDPGLQPNPSGYVRGGGYSASGGGWLYDCQQGDDNSTSQWAAIGLIAGFRGFNLAIPQVVKDMNNVWVTNSQDVTDPHPTGTDPYASNDNYGAFGYRGALAYSNAWGPFAVTPSGLVQMALDGIGRTDNTAFGNSSNAADQRWNNTETFYADNFCNITSNGAYYSPRAYTYGMFSFTKSMLLHDPGGVLTPIKYLRTLTPNVFTGDSSDPANEIDWYAALSPANGGTDACDGVAQTLVSYQSADGHWYGNDYDQGYQADQSPFETAWSIIMLDKTVFNACVKNLAGRGTPSGVGAAQITLGWTGQSQATGYAVLRGTVSGGPYTQVGTTTSTVYNDRSGLKNGDTYYYVVQPLQGTTEICQSNQATITIPK